jgi:hypothetical protein
MDQIQQFSQAILNGVGQAAPSSYIPEIANAMRSQFALGGVASAGKGMSAVSSQIADDEEKRRQAARQQQIQALQDKMDPSKYQKLRKDDGGFAFFDPEGKEIDIDTFSKRTGQRRVDVLKDSENPIDQQYIHDWSTMNDVSQALYTGDRTTIEALKGQYPELFSGGVTPQVMAEKLMKQYPHMYGRGSYQESLGNLNKPLFRFRTDDLYGSGGGAWSTLQSLAGN